MSYKTVTVDVEVCVNDIIDDIDDKDLIAGLNNRGYTVTKDEKVFEVFEREDWRFLLELVDKNTETVYTRRVRDKLMEACYG